MSALNCILFIHSVAKSNKTCHQISFASILLGIVCRGLQVFLLLIFVNTTLRSSWINCLSLLSRLPLIFVVVGVSVTLMEFPSRFLKCSFLFCVHFSWQADFSIALEGHFLLLTLLTVYYANTAYLSIHLYLLNILIFFYFNLWLKLKHNVLIIDGDMNAQIDKIKQYICSRNSSNRNRKCLTDFLLEHKVIYFNTKF